MRHLPTTFVCAALLSLLAISCSGKKQTQYVGEWVLAGISLDGKHWDEGLVPDDGMTITINANGTLVMCVGDFSEQARWYVDDKGDIVMSEQHASIDDEGYLVADHDGMIVRMTKR